MGEYKEPDELDEYTCVNGIYTTTKLLYVGSIRRSSEILDLYLERGVEV